MFKVSCISYILLSYSYNGVSILIIASLKKKAYQLSLGKYFTKLSIRMHQNWKLWYVSMTTMPVNTRYVSRHYNTLDAQLTVDNVYHSDRCINTDNAYRIVDLPLLAFGRIQINGNTPFWPTHRTPNTQPHLLTHTCKFQLWSLIFKI